MKFKMKQDVFQDCKAVQRQEIDESDYILVITYYTNGSNEYHRTSITVKKKKLYGNFQDSPAT